MRHLTMKPLIVAAAVVLGLQAGTARAQFVQVYSPPAVLAPQPVYSYYPPTTTYYAPPVTSYYAPVTSYYAAPVTTYYPPTVNYSYCPPTTVYSAPVAVAPTVAVPVGTVTTRSFVGYGVFRPRGVYTQSYYTPGWVP